MNRGWVDAVKAGGLLGVPACTSEALRDGRALRDVGLQVFTAEQCCRYNFEAVHHGSFCVTVHVRQGLNNTTARTLHHRHRVRVREEPVTGRRLCGSKPARVRSRQ